MKQNSKLEEPWEEEDKLKLFGILASIIITIVVYSLSPSLFYIGLFSAIGGICHFYPKEAKNCYDRHHIEMLSAAIGFLYALPFGMAPLGMIAGSICGHFINKTISATTQKINTISNTFFPLFSFVSIPTRIFNSCINGLTSVKNWIFEEKAQDSRISPDKCLSQNQIVKMKIASKVNERSSLPVKEQDLRSPLSTIFSSSYLMEPLENLAPLSEKKDFLTEKTSFTQELQQALEQKNKKEEEPVDPLTVTRQNPLLHYAILQEPPKQAPPTLENSKPWEREEFHCLYF